MSRRPGRGFDLAVIGGGIAGLTAAWHAALRGSSVLLFEPEDGLFGGQVANVGALDGFPAAAPAGGAALADALLRAGGGLGVETVRARVRRLAADGRRVTIETAAETHRAKQAILASGARLRRLGIPGEAELAGRGVSQCAWCDGGLFRGEDVVVIGGGDAALQEALHLSACRSVTVVTRGPRLRARQAYVARAADDPRFTFRWNSAVEAILGDRNVEAIRLREAGSGAVEEIACAGVFVFVGVEPNAGYLPPEVARDAAGAVVTDDALRTSLPGVFAAGAVRSGYRGQLANAVGEAAAAAIAAAGM